MLEVQILVVDDDPDVCEYLTTMLGREGYRADSLTDPCKVEGALREKHYHLVIVDLMMPGMGGLELLSRIRLLDKDIAIIVFTGYPSVESAMESIKHEVSGYLKKPVSIDEFRDVVRHVLEKKGLSVDPEVEFHKVIGHQIRELRIQNELTLKQLSHRTGLSVSLLSQIERAESSASISSLFKISKALTVPMTRLFGGE